MYLITPTNRLTQCHIKFLIIFIIDIIIIIIIVIITIIIIRSLSLLLLFLKAVQESMYEWLHGKAEGGRVAIFDATNTTIARRLALAQRARKENVFLLGGEHYSKHRAGLQEKKVCACRQNKPREPAE